MDAILEQIRDCIGASYGNLQECNAYGNLKNPHCTTAVIQGLADSREYVACEFGENPNNLNCCHGQITVSPKDQGEWMLDFALTTSYSRDASRRWPCKKRGILLAAESEWHGGVEGLLNDFWKLTGIHAAIKVMIYAFIPEELGEIHGEFVDLLGNHRGQDRSERWLFLGFPWGNKSKCVHGLDWETSSSVPRLKKISLGILR